MVRRACAGIVLVLLGALTVLGQGQPLELIAPPLRSALPGDIVTLTFIAINRGTASDTYLFSVSVPQGFQALGALPPLTIAPNAQEPVFVTLLVLQETPAGTYTITLEAVSQSDPSVKASTQTTIVVEKTVGVIVRAPDPQEVDPGTEVILAFSVTNRGNVIDTFRLDAFTPRGFPTRVDPGLIELLPGETRSVLVAVKIPAETLAGFEPVTLTAVSLRTEGVQANGATTLIILPPEAAKVPTALYLLAPAELAVGAHIAFASSALTPLISFLTYATLPEEQRFSIKITISDIVRSQIPSGLPINVKEFLFTSQRGTFFVHLGDLPQSPLLYNLLPRRGVELGFTDFFSLMATFEDQDGDFIQEQRAMALSFNGTSLRAALARLSVAGATPYTLTAANFRSGMLSAEGAVAEISAGLRRMFFLRAAPAFFGVTLGGEYLRVEPDFPSLIGVPSVIADTQIWTLFGNASAGALGFSALISGKTTDLFSQPTVQEVSSIISQGRLVLRGLLPGWPSVFFDVKFILRRSNDPPFAPLSTNEDIKSLTIADIASPISYILTLQSNLFRDNLNPANNTDTFELISALITRPVLSIEGLSLSLSAKSIFQVDPNTNTTLDHQVTFIGRLAFTNPRVSTYLLLGLNTNLLYPFFSSYFGSFSTTLFGPVSASFAFSFTEPSSLSFNIEVRTKFDMPFESVIIKGRVEGYLFIDLNNNGQRDPNEPGVQDALLRLDDQLARTNAQGYFRFPPVGPGSYRIEIARAPLGLVATVPTPIPVTVAIGQVVSLEIPMRAVGIIRGRVFDDKNRNGKADPDEPGLVNVRVFAVGTATSTEARSGANGQYILQVPPGSYTVTLDRTTLPKRYEPTTPVTVSVTVQTGQTVTVDFGAYEVPRPVLFAPIADFTFTPAQPKVGEKVTFDASASTDSDGQIVRYEWDFNNDGKPDAVGKLVEWVFTSAGDFPVKLTVTDNDDLQNSVTKVVSVRP